MELPVWHFVGIGSGLIIGIVSVLHVFVAQFAVGGGIYLVWMERKAYRDGTPEILQWLERHTHFFLLLTMVFGGLSGVGIWFTMSVVNPGATSMLIHNFVFFWAAEWGLFLLEVVSLLVYYYTYPWSRSGRMSPETHMRIGIVYACAGFLSLVLINGIITFMLTPGQGLATGNVWLTESERHDIEPYGGTSGRDGCAEIVWSRTVHRSAHRLSRPGMSRCG